MKINKMMLVGVTAAVMAAAIPISSMASAVIVAGGGSGASTTSAGPGAEPGVSQLELIPGRVDYFSAQVPNPVVKAVEKYSYEQMVQDISSLQSRYGDRMHVNTFGTSLDGRALYEIVLGNPDAPKHVLIHAGIHGREYMTPLLVMKQLEYGLEFYDSGNYAGDPLSYLLSNVAVHFVPMVNPDGIALSQFGISAIRSEELRKAIEQCYASDIAQGRTSAPFDQYLVYWKANACGVDLNQNFPADWEQVDSCPDPSYATYRGESALSEPESQALANLTSSREWKATISYHSMGNVIYWDYAGNRVQQASGELATIVAANTGYRTASSSGHGGYKDWTQIKDGAIPGLTIETGSVACPLPLSEFSDIWYRNKMVWALVVKYVQEH